MTEEKRPPHDRGQGRKTINPSGEVMEAHTIRMTREEWLKLKALGGPKWVRERIRLAKIRNDGD